MLFLHLFGLYITFKAMELQCLSLTPKVHLLEINLLYLQSRVYMLFAQVYIQQAQYMLRYIFTRQFSIHQVFTSLVFTRYIFTRQLQFGRSGSFFQFFLVFVCFFLVFHNFYQFSGRFLVFLASYLLVTYWFLAGFVSLI